MRQNALFKFVDFSTQLLRIGGVGGEVGEYAIE